VTDNIFDQKYHHKLCSEVAPGLCCLCCEPQDLRSPNRCTTTNYVIRLNEIDTAYSVTHNSYLLRPDVPSQTMRLGLYKILFYFGAIVQESTILLFPPPICMAHPSVILLHDFNTIYDSLSDLPCVCYTPYKIRNNNIL